MRIKHWQGYGSVEAKKLSKKTRGNITKVEIEVIGNHEWGIYRNDTYDVHRWLCSKFAKDCKDSRDIMQIDIDIYEKDINGICTDMCIYKITYSNNIP